MVREFIVKAGVSADTELKRGMYVRFINHPRDPNGPQKGWVGVIKDRLDFEYGVEYDEWFAGGHYLNGLGSTGHGWYSPASDLEPVDALLLEEVVRNEGVQTDGDVAQA